MMLYGFQRFIAGRRAASISKSATPAQPRVEPLEHRRMMSVAAPINPTAIGVSASSILLHWSASLDPSVKSYDVFAVTYVSGGGGKGGGHPGHYNYSPIATNLAATSDLVTGLVTGTYHTYAVTAVSPAGNSYYSTFFNAETWIAPSLPYGSAVLLSEGAVYSSPVSVTAGQTTQITLLAAGNPMTYSVQKGPSTVSINPVSGVVTYTPALKEAGTVAITFKVQNTLGFVTQTVQFDVIAANPKLAKPKLVLNGTTFIYNSQYQQVGATAFGVDGTTQIAGTFAFAYNGSPGYPNRVGTYQVLVTFTSADPKYAGATLLSTLKIVKATPIFSEVMSPTVAVGTTTTTISGNIAAGIAYPTGEGVIIKIDGVSQTAMVGLYGQFSIDFPTGLLSLGTHTISYSFPGDLNYNSATAFSKLYVIPTAVPKVTLNPADTITTAGDYVIFTAAATGSNPPTVQWQVSSDGGQTYTDIYDPYGTTLSFAADASQNGYLYRAVFTNSVGVAITSAAMLTIQIDTGGNGGN